MRHAVDFKGLCHIMVMDADTSGGSMAYAQVLFHLCQVNQSYGGFSLSQARALDDQLIVHGIYSSEVRAYAYISSILSLFDDF